MLSTNKISSELNQELEGKHFVFVHGYLKMGGAERQSLWFADYLKKHFGCQITFVGFGGKGNVIEACNERGITCHYKPLPMDKNRWHFLDVFRFALWLRTLRPDFLAPYCLKPNLICGSIWHLTGAKACVWQQRDEGRGFLHSWMLHLARWQLKRYVSNSEHAADWLQKKMRVPAHKIRVIDNGIRVPNALALRAAGQNWRQEQKVSDQQLLVAMVANLTPYKDHLTLAKAWKILLDTWIGRSPLLLLAGYFGGTHEELRAYLQRENLMDQVRILGQVQDVQPLLGASDLLVHSSVQEGCPNAVLEGMAAGLPVVGTDIPGIRRAVGLEGHDYLAPIGRSDILAHKLALLLSDTEKRHQLGQAMRRRVETQFSITRMAKQTATVFIEAGKGAC